jgi:hypothetical protein
MSGRRSRSKGARTERRIVNALQAYGLAAVRAPLSVAVGGRFAGDIILPLMGRDPCVVVKARADGFRELCCWLNERDTLIVKADRQEPLVFLRMSLAAEIERHEQSSSKDQPSRDRARNSRCKESRRRRS